GQALATVCRKRLDRGLASAPCVALRLVAVAIGGGGPRSVVRARRTISRLGCRLRLPRSGAGLATWLLRPTAAVALAAQLDRLRLRIRVRLEADDDFRRQLALDQLFDVLQHHVLVDADQRDGFAGCAGAARAADAVYI